MSVQWDHYVIKHPFFCMHTLLFLEHAIGASDVTASFDLQVNPEGQEGSQEVEVQQVGPEELEEEVECPSHEPASFVKDDIFYDGFCKTCLHPAGDED